MKKFTTRWPDGIYGKLKAYAKEEEISMMAAILQIIKEFFKQQK